MQLVEHHLRAATSDKATGVTFITVLQPHRAGEEVAGRPELLELEAGFAVRVPLAQGTLQVPLQADAGPRISAWGVSTRAPVAAVIGDAQGRPLDRFEADR